MPEAFTNFWFLLFGMITVIVVVGTVAIAMAATHRTREEYAFKTQMLERGMSVEDIERLMAASAKPGPGPGGLSEDSLNEVVAVLGRVSASPSVIEEVLWAFRSLDTPTQEAVSQAMQYLIDSDPNETTGEQLLAVVRPMCPPKESPNDQIVPIRDERIRQDAQ